MKHIDIIVHCYAEKRPDFAKLLTAQLSSVVAHPPKKATVCFRVISSFHDQATEQATDFLDKELRDVGHAIELTQLSNANLFRRAVGRNMLALESTADIVWFADCDYMFGDGCLDALADANLQGLGFPQEVSVHRSHQVGDLELSRIEIGELFEPDLSLFVPQRFRFAIGGLQIVDGDNARAHGYLNDTRWVKPASRAKDFQDTKEDRVYRAQFKSSTRLSLPNLYRMRHSSSAFESPADRLKQTADK